MKKSIVLITLLMASVASAKIQGDLLCWDKSDSTALISMYRGSGMEEFNDKLDTKGRRSFIVQVGRDFDEDATWNEKGNVVAMGWSISECEDQQGIRFPKKDLERVLFTQKGRVTGSFESEGPDSTTKIELECEGLTVENTAQPQLIEYY